MKNIKELTDDEAKEILDFALPNDDTYFKTVSFEAKREADGSQQVTMSMLPIIGIQYRNDYGDGCLLPFHDSRVMLWLYRHDYDIGEYLEYNKHSSQAEQDFENFSFLIYEMGEGKYNKYTKEELVERLKKLSDDYDKITY